MRLSALDQAELIRDLLNMRDRIDAALEIMCGDEDPAQVVCHHPADQIEDLSTMDDEGELYRCKRCGFESPTPFISTHPE